MVLTKKIAWVSFWWLCCFGIITLATASLEADVDGTNDYGFPLQFSRSGGNFLNLITGEHEGANEFSVLKLGLDLLFALMLVLIIRFILAKYKRSGKLGAKTH
jgi:hypothetical protein